MSAPLQNQPSSPAARPVRRAALSTAFVLITAVALVAACGGRRNESSTPAATEPATAPPAAIEPTAAPAATDAPATATTAPTAETAAATATLSGSATVSATAAVTGTAPVTTATGATEVVAAPGCTIETSPELAGFSGAGEGLGCPTAEGAVETVAINEFGAGPDYNRFMLWFANEQQIYVLQPNGSWLAYTDTWRDSDPEISCNPEDLDPPTSPPLPRRGFGKLWCSVPSVRAVMGTIDREERQCQHAVVQRFEQGRLLACFEDATIRYFRLLEDGTWDMEMVQ